MNITEQKQKLEEGNLQLEKLKMVYAKLKDDTQKHEECNELSKQIMQLEYKIAEIEKQLKVNALMLEYSLKKKDSNNRGCCTSLKEQVAIIMFSNRDGLIRTAKKYYSGRGTKEDYEDAVQEALFECIEQYDSSKNDNFCAYFFNSLLNTVRKALGKEYIDTKKQSKGDKQKDVKPNMSKKETALSPTEVNCGNGRYKKRGESIDSNPDSPPISDPFSTPDETMVHRRVLEEFYAKMAVCVIRISGKNGEPDRFFRAFATEQYIKLCREHMHNICDINENEAFTTVMDTKFADFTLIARCRSFAEIEMTPCRTYDEIGLNGKGEIAFPFEPRVYKTYHNVSSGRITQKRDEFNEKLGIPRHKER